MQKCRWFWCKYRRSAVQVRARWGKRIQYSEKGINVRGINKHIKTKAIKLKVLYFVAFYSETKKKTIYMLITTSLLLAFERWSKERDIFRLASASSISKPIEPSWSKESFSTFLSKIPSKFVELAKSLKAY